MRRVETVRCHLRSLHRRHGISHCSSSHCHSSLWQCSAAHFPLQGRKIQPSRPHQLKPESAQTRMSCWIAGWIPEVEPWGCVQSVGPSCWHRHQRNSLELTEEREHNPSRALESTHQTTFCCCCCCSQEELPSWGVVGTLKPQALHWWRSLFRLPVGKESAGLLWCKLM